MKFEQIGREIGAMTDVKNKAYGDSVARSGDILRILYPNGIQPEQYGDMQLVTRMIDKMFRIATDKHALGESPFRDIAGYGLLGAAKDERPDPAVEARLNAIRVGEAAAIAQDIIHKATKQYSFGISEAKVDGQGNVSPVEILCDPGPGYRLLRYGEKVPAMAEMYVQSVDAWYPIGTQSPAIGNEYTRDNNTFIRIKIDPEEMSGYRYLGYGDAITDDTEFKLLTGEWQRLPPDSGSIGRTWNDDYQPMRRPW